jgi:hypothetical protein
VIFLTLNPTLTQKPQFARVCRRSAAADAAADRLISREVKRFDTPRSRGLGDGGNYEAARFNALRHGVLSQYTILPWENGAEYAALVEALAEERSPQGPTEEHLVEELASIIWRKRRLRLAESAAHHRALKPATDLYQETAKAALIQVAGHQTDESQSVDDAIRATEEQTAEDRADLEGDEAMTERALGLLNNHSSTAYGSAVAALRDDPREWWEEQLSWKRSDYEKGVKPYRANGESLERFLEREILPWYEKRRRELENRPLIRAQAFGEAVDPRPLARSPC